MRKLFVVNNMFQIKTSLFVQQTTDNSDKIAHALSKIFGCNDWGVKSSQESGGFKFFKEEKLRS